MVAIKNYTILKVVYKKVKIVIRTQVYFNKTKYVEF